MRFFSIEIPRRLQGTGIRRQFQAQTHPKLSEAFTGGHRHRQAQADPRLDQAFAGNIVTYLHLPYAKRCKP